MPTDVEFGRGHGPWPEPLKSDRAQFLARGRWSGPSGVGAPRSRRDLLPCWGIESAHADRDGRLIRISVPPPDPALEADVDVRPPGFLGHGLLGENPMSKEVGGMVGSRRVQGAGSARTEGARRASGVGADGAAAGARGLGARAAVEREPETGRGSAAAARRVAGHGLA